MAGILQSELSVFGILLVKVPAFMYIQYSFDSSFLMDLLLESLSLYFLYIAVPWQSLYSVHVFPQFISLLLFLCIFYQIVQFLLFLFS